MVEMSQRYDKFKLQVLTDMGKISNQGSLHETIAIN